MPLSDTGFAAVVVFCVREVPRVAEVVVPVCSGISSAEEDCVG